MENMNKPMIRRDDGKVVVVHDALLLTNEEYNDIKRQYPTLTDKNLIDIALEIINTPNVFVNSQFINPNNNFYNYIKLKMSNRQKQERLHGGESTTSQNDISNNEISKDESMQNQNTNEETPFDNPINENRKKEDNDFNEKKEFIKEILLKFTQFCEDFSYIENDGELSCRDECPFFSENKGCLIKDNNPLSQEKVATILMIHYKRTKESGESVVFDYVNDKIKDLTEEEKNMIRESI